MCIEATVLPTALENDIPDELIFSDIKLAPSDKLTFASELPFFSVITLYIFAVFKMGFCTKLRRFDYIKQRFLVIIYTNQRFYIDFEKSVWYHLSVGAVKTAPF